MQVEGQAGVECENIETSFAAINRLVHSVALLYLAEIKQKVEISENFLVSKLLLIT